MARERSSWRSVFHGLVVATAVCAALVLAFHVVMFGRSVLRNPSIEHVVALFFLWQTQTGAAIALVAAIVGATVILHQTRTNRAIEEDRLARRATALRAVLPVELSELSDYASRCGKISVDLLAKSGSGTIKEPDLRYPPLPTGLVERVLSLIETLEPHHARPLCVLAQQVQIHHARMRDTEHRATTDEGSLLLRPNVIARIVDSAELHARCDALFRYARGDASKPAEPIRSDDVRRSVFFIARVLPDQDEVEQEIDARAKAKSGGATWPLN